MIRKAKNNDIETISKIYIDSRRKTYKNILPDDYLNSLTYGQAEKKWTEYLENDNNIIFVHLDDNGTITSLAASKPYRHLKNCLYLDSLHVSPEFQSKGVGKSLILKTAVFALENGYDSMTISILKGNDRAGKIYQYLGAVYLNDFINYFDNTSAMSTVFIWKDLQKLINKHSK